MKTLVCFLVYYELWSVCKWKHNITCTGQKHGNCISNDNIVDASWYLQSHQPIGLDYSSAEKPKRESDTHTTSISNILSMQENMHHICRLFIRICRYSQMVWGLPDVSPEIMIFQVLSSGNYKKRSDS